MKDIEERLNHIGELVRGLSEQTSGNITIINANCQMLANRLEEIEKKLQELEDFNTPAEQKLELLRKQIDKVDKRLEELEIKTASDLSQKKEASEEAKTENIEQPKNEDSIAQDCLWLARSKSGRLYSFTEKPKRSLNGEHWNGRNILYWGMSKYKSLTFENSPQKLVLESVVAESETSEEQDCAWVARDEGGLFAFSEEPEFFRGEWSSDSDYHKLPANLFPQVTFENSPQKLVLESSISKMETVGKAGQDAFTELRALLEEAEKDNREKYPDESMMKFILERMREVIE